MVVPSVVRVESATQSRMCACQHFCAREERRRVANTMPNAPTSLHSAPAHRHARQDAVLESREEELPAKRYVDGYEEVFQNEPGPMSLWGRCL